MTSPLARQFAERVVGYRLRDADTEVLAAARTAVIDTLGVTLLGSREPCTRVALEALLPVSDGPATLAGTARGAGVLDAAFFNGIAAHANDFDDFTQAFGGHPSVPIVPGLLALAEAHGFGGRALIEAYVAGVELETRIAHGVHFEHYEKGWHPTSTLGVFGAAAAASRLMGLDVGTTTTALAIAASLASGLKANFGTMTKPMHVGHCARSGVQAALLARGGFSADADIFEHRQGFLRVYNGEGAYRTAPMLVPWFDPPLVLSPGIGLKQFACCGSTHPSIYMALELRRKGLEPEQIRSLRVLTHPRRLPHTDNPDPTSGLEAKFSLQYCVARALVSGEPRLAHFEDAAVGDPAVRALMRNLSAGAHPDMAEHSPQNFGAQVVAELQDGTSVSAMTPHLPGRGADNPMSEAEMRAKFEDCSRGVLAQGELERLWERLCRLETLTDLRGLLAARTPGAAAA